MRRILWGRKKRRTAEIHPDEILIDSKNLAHFDTDRLEGRIERPLSRRSFLFVGGILTFLFLGFLARASDLQLIQGEAYATQARENQLAETTIFADRGLIVDRTGTPLAWNEKDSPEDDFAQRIYATQGGIAHVVGYVKPPAKDSSGIYFQETYLGVDGVEKVFDAVLAGQNGIELTETDARGKVVSKARVREPLAGEKLALSIDADVSSGFFEAVAQRAEESRFQGGAGVLMDIQTGEIIALVNYPEFSPTALTSGDPAIIQALLSDPRQPFLNRATAGLYAPGSIVKPFVAVGALTEGVIDESTEILSTGSISIPNPYFPDKPSVFKDWKAHGWVDMRHAIAVSSDVYFYEVGGGFQNQRGLGIAGLDKYFKLFGFATLPGLLGFSQEEGLIPTPAWKEEVFDGDPWRIGDTYNTAIGQYGVQVTPLQAVRAIAAVANGGILVTPTLLASSTAATAALPIDPHTFAVVREGMRLGVEGGTAAAVSVLFVKMAAKTGTAQVGTRNQFMNSWIIGFFPYEAPRYAFALVLERAPAGTLTGAPAAMRTFLDWLNANAPEYFQ
ncbi:hypothetical protein A2943_03280 [Candidatus Adlerbacteria bacterium RIFCSPLOWO2_01_FULL_51_16]|uniref:Penicillin-binding protein 2 n=1 Tax=Candidatus Adlerbacteria bacterium RIFCSPLOWO2_01_FULL_51_16 TaxID=1797243 RepID=A0A1F4XEK4_9BACT|nr:MAG: hypothetical protein A2943_03280 [Candidatus Adlerbacteria bacterium RIFCSPLOWO2_01_FULL_51_16]